MTFMIQSERAPSETERLDRLRLSRTAGIGPITFRALMERFGSAESAIAALPRLAAGRPMTVPGRDAAAREVDAIARIGAVALMLGDAGYPALLAMAEDAPPVLIVKGRLELLAPPAVGIVGARNASANGKRLAATMARALGEAGHVVISGFARGIDASAHGGALATGTVAAMAGGIDIVYPPENQSLYDRIAEIGAMVSECAIGTQPTARHFPRRNRLIAGLSLGIVVIEAAQRSGSLITARLAAEYGRQVLAVPGSPMDPRAQGCNALIRNGATLVESAGHVAEALATQMPIPAPGPEPAPLPRCEEPPAASLAEARRVVEENLSPEPTAVDELLRGCQLSAPAVLTVLLELELAGRLERHPGNMVSLLAA
jgi:DNA processing protein